MSLTFLHSTPTPRGVFMKKRIHAALLLAAPLAGCSPGLEEAAESGAGARPSLLLVTLDTTRRDHLGAYGGAPGLTPILDELAAEGVTFLDPRTQVPITLPSHATLLTGLGVLEHGLRENGAFVLDETADTLAERLRKGGWQTAAFVSSFVLDRRFGLAQGFDTYDDEMLRGERRNWHGQDVPRFERPGDATTDRALAWLAGRKEETPVFLWVHYYDPHAPYSPPRPAPPAYEAEVAFMDAQVGRLVEAVRTARPDTLVVVASDHGESLGEHGIRGHGSDLFEPAMAAVLLLQHPELLPRGRRVEARVDLADVAATVLDLLGVADGLPGESLRPWIDGTALPPLEPVYMETLFPALRHGRSPLHGLLDGPWKIIWQPGERRVALFDLAADPGETADLAEAEAERVRRMSRMLSEILATPRGSAGRPVEMDPETVEKLRALGYVD